MHLESLPIHPRTRLRAVGIVGGRPVWPILGGSGDGPPAGGDPGTGNPPTPAPPAPAPDPPAPEPSGPGFPADTPVSEMTPVEQAAYWKDKARKHETVVKKRGDYDQLKADSDQLKKLRKEHETDTERATREAADKARADTMAKVGRQLVMAEFRAAAGGRIDAERLAVLTDDLDPGRYLDDDGNVDGDRVAAKVAAWAPASTTPPPPRTPKPDHSQGARGGDKPKGTDAGREMFAARRKRPAPATP